MRKGFTLVEIIIVLGITIMLTSVLIVYTRGGEKQIIFFKDQTVLVSSLLRAKAFAIETFQPKLQPGLDPAQEIICGWGVSFSRNSKEYTIFKDLPIPNDTDCANANKSFDKTGEAFEAFEFSEIVEIDCLALNGSLNGSCLNSNNESKIDIVFIPPDPLTEFYPKKLPETKEAVIVITLKDKTRNSVIRITKAGQISFR